MCTSNHFNDLAKEVGTIYKANHIKSWKFEINFFCCSIEKKVISYFFSFVSLSFFPFTSWWWWALKNEKRVWLLRIIINCNLMHEMRLFMAVRRRSFRISVVFWNSLTNLLFFISLKNASEEVPKKKAKNESEKDEKCKLFWPPVLIIRTNILWRNNF